MNSSPTYPRPDFQRPSLNWKSLDGPWDFVFDDQDSGVSQKWQENGICANEASSQKRTITVPFAFQAPASGIGLHEAHEVIWYERTVTDIRTPDEMRTGNCLLVRFGAVDYECFVWLDGQLVGGHRGGHVPFDLDLTDALKSNSTETPARLTVRVRDSPHDLTQLRGKQYWKPVSEDIFYAPTSGIWQSVWLESVPALRLSNSSEGTVLRSDDIDKGELHALVAVSGRKPGAKCSVEIESSLGGIFVSKIVKDLPESKQLVSLDVGMRVPNSSDLRTRAPYDADGCWLNDVALWHPDHPVLYDLVLRLYDGAGALVDEVHTTTGMRKVDWQNGDGTFRLNGKPLWQALVLDQGYWPETGLTPPSAEALKADIEMTMRMGFNGCRKHQKVEDPLFLYWADRLGFLVWGEIANAYEFDETYVDRFNSEWTEAVKRDINHPCIITWTPGNESWGYTSLGDNIEQRNHIRSVYYLTKSVSAI
ncbi:uncharacterized protein PFLUO_LOCUS3213 [Penicillium psychrofluorescens]|uniref:uncharacterized protein n=1 Tax=Penicillium psychrofluorescens TaxID=3158075 RepID=UPI003CCDF133